MEKHSDMFSSYGIFILFAILVLVPAQPARAQRTEEQIVQPPAATSSTTVAALARQIAFVKSFSATYPYQYQQKTHNEKTDNSYGIDKKNRSK